MISGTQCRQARTSLRLNRPELARLAGISSSQIKRLELAANPSATVTDKIERALDAAGRGLSKDDVEKLNVVLNRLADLIYCISTALMHPQSGRELFAEIHRSALALRDCAMPPRVPKAQLSEVAE
jgi:transcriptional regulator with XRE-family HTH domain